MNLDFAIDGDEDILGLHVAVDDACPVQGLDALQELLHDALDDQGVPLLVIVLVDAFGSKSSSSNRTAEAAAAADSEAPATKRQLEVA